MNPKEEEKTFKIVMIGDSGVGKTCLMIRYANDTFSEEFQSTVGVDFMSKNAVIGNNKFMLQIWDTAGQERYRTITSAYYRDSHGIAIVFDLTDNKSFEKIPYWIDSVNEYAPKDAQVILIGNKKDLDKKLEVSSKKGENIAKEFGVKYCEASAKTGEGVNEAFEILVNLVNQKMFGPSYIKNDSISLKDEEKGKCGNCCK